MTPDQIPGEVVAAAKRADHDEGIRDGRSYHEVADHQVRRLIAGAVAAERARLADRQQVIDEVKAELDDAFQFTDRDGSRHGYVTRAWVESLLAHHAASAVAAERERLAQLADQKRAGYEDLGTGEPGLAQYGSYVPFADLIREGGDG